MKKRIRSILGIVFGIMLAFTIIPAGMTAVLAAPSQSAPTVSVDYQDGAFSASNGFSVTQSTEGTITPSTVLQNGYGFTEDAYYSVTAPAGKAFTAEDGGLSFSFDFRTTTNVQGKGEGGVEKSEQLFHVVAPSGLKAFICMGTVYYQNTVGGGLQAMTRDAADGGYKALTTEAKEITISIPADGSGIHWFANGVELYSFAGTAGPKTAALFLEALREEGSTLYVHKGATSKTAYMTDTIEMGDFAVYGKALMEAELLTERAKNISLTEKFSISYSRDGFKTSSDDIVVTTDGDGLAPDEQNAKAFHFTNNVTSVKISATNDTALSENGTMSMVFLQRVTNADTSGYLERLLSVENEDGESGDILLGELECYRYTDGDSGGSEETRELTRETVVKSKHQQLLKSEEYQLVMITVGPGAIRVYINGKLAQYYLETGSGSKEPVVVPFVTDMFAAELSANNGTLILRRQRTTSASWNKDVLCIGNIKFFDRELDEVEAYAYYMQNTADATIDALTDGEYNAYAYGTGVRPHVESTTRNAFAFRDTEAYVAVEANDGKAITENDRGISFHVKQRQINTSASSNTEEALFTVESGSVGAYINLGSLSYYDGENLTTVAASNPTALFSDEWRIVSVVVNKEAKTVQVYADGTLVDTYTSNGANSTVAKVVELFSEEASKLGGKIYVRKSFDSSQNNTTLALERLIIAEGGLSATEVVGFSNRFVNVVSVNVETNIDHVIPPFTGEVGEVIPAPTEIPNGYEFLGYYTDDAYTTPLAVGATFTPTITQIWAKFELNHYVITYHLNGGSQASGNVTSYTSTESVIFYDAVKEGYVFEGWYRTADFHNRVSRLLVGVMGDVELYAKFSPIVYEINYVLNNGLMVADNAPTSYTVEDSITLVDAWRPYYTFEGWYKEATFINKVTNFDSAQATNVTLYAKFTPLSFSVVWEANGGTLSENAPTEYTAADTVIQVSANKQYYQFAGWYLEPTLETRVDTFAGLNRDVTLYAKFTLAVYTVHYELNGGELNGDAVTTYTIEDTEITLVDASKPGYVFEGWYADAEFTTRVETIDPAAGGDVTLYAKFTSTRKGCGGVISEGALPFASIAAVTLTLGIFLRKKETH